MSICKNGCTEIATSPDRHTNRSAFPDLAHQHIGAATRVEPAYHTSAPSLRQGQGHIGILGLDRAGVENYQITLGGDGTEDAVIGTRTGPGFAYDEIVGAVETIVTTYLGLRRDAGETFLQAYRRVGIEPFKAALYPEAKTRAA